VGHKVSVLDLNVQPNDLEKKVKSIDLVGITTVTNTIKASWELCERVKESNPYVTTVLGGPHATALPQESLYQPAVDVVVRGEGEETIVELCDKQEKGGSLEDVDGISYKKNGRIHHNRNRKLIKNLENLPFPAYHLFPMEKYTGPHATFLKRRWRGCAVVLTSRGCPYNCVFCCKETFGRQFRYRSPENVVEEIRFLIDNYRINFFGVEDDAFTLIKSRASEICNLIVKEGLDITWETSNGIRVDSVSLQLFEDMKKAGCIRVWYGTESGSQRVLDHIINKGTTLQQAEEAVKLAKKVKFEVGTFWVLGNPGETREDLDMTINFAIKLDPDYATFTIATPYPGTRLYEMIKDRLLITDWDLYGHYQGKAFFEYDETTPELVEHYFKRAYRKFYLRPSFILRTFLKTGANTNFLGILKNIAQVMG